MSASTPITLIVAAAALALGAGVSGGMLMARLPAGHAADASASASPAAPLAEQLSLTAVQRKEMQRIWEDVRRTANDCLEDGRVLQRQREDSLIGLLNDEQKSRFEKIAQDYADRFRKLSRERNQAFAKGVEETRAILNPSQRTQYEAILSDRVGGATLRAVLRETASPPAPGLDELPATAPGLTTE